MSRPGGMLYSSSQEKKLARGVELMREGNTSAAIDLLAALAAEPGAPGITDEALFRLSLLHIGAGLQRSGILKAEHDLQRLKKEYPSSPWAIVAGDLTEFLASADSARQSNKRLKELNLSLTRDNREVRQSIDKLKKMDLELGKGSKR